MSIMASRMAENENLDYALRALQVIFAVIVMGTDGWAISVYRGHVDYVHSQFGNFYAYAGVPNAWGFLVFCAGWTALSVIFHFIAKNRFTNRVWVGYIRLAIEAVALLSWFAGFIAVAVEIGTYTSCSEGANNTCGTLTAAVVFGAIEWLLFVITTVLTGLLVFNSSHKPWTSSTNTASENKATSAIGRSSKIKDDVSV